MTVTDLMVELQRLAQQGEGGRRVIVLGDHSQSEEMDIILSKTGFAAYFIGKPVIPPGPPR